MPSRAPASTQNLIVPNRFGFDLHGNFRRDQSFDFNLAWGRSDVLESLSVVAEMRREDWHTPPRGF